mgnify:CR=1 FL=1
MNLQLKATEHVALCKVAGQIYVDILRCNILASLLSLEILGDVFPPLSKHAGRFISL